MKHLHQCCAAWLFLVAALLPGCGETKDPPPNIILILADDLGYNDLSCYREAHEGKPGLAPTSRTPHIDRLAEEGMRFTDFYCGAAVCSPSRAALLTGRNSTRVGIYNWIPPRQPMHLRDREVTLAEMLGEAGYRTAHFGKWHLTAEGMGQPLPEDQGYETSFFTYNNANPSHHNPVNFFRDTTPAGPLEGYACQLVVDEALDWLRQREGENAPFYINVWFNEPHERVAAPGDLRDRHSRLPDYFGCIENMDLAVGRLLSYLEEQGLDGNTLVIFTSDNGSQVPASNDPLRGEKAFNLEGGIRTPFLVRWPGNIPSGTVETTPGSFTDVMPTLAAITLSDLPGDRVIDGIDLAPLILGTLPQFERGEPIFFFRYFHEPVCMLREGDWVLLGYQGEPLGYRRDYNQKELANLKPDPDRPEWSMWGFQPRHMEYLVTAVPESFQLFNIREDIAQQRDLIEIHTDIAEKMKLRMLELREEMIAEGGDWYD